MHIRIEAGDDAQEMIDRSQVGDTVTFHGAFHLEAPLTFWYNRDYSGSEATFHVRHAGIECRNKPGERASANRLAQWLSHHLSFPASAEPLSYAIEEDTTVLHEGRVIVDKGQILAPLPRSPWYFYQKRWLARQLLKSVHAVFWFPRGGSISGFYLRGDPHPVTELRLNRDDPPRVGWQLD